MDRQVKDVFDGVRMTAAGKQALIEELTSGGRHTAPAPRRALRTSLVAAAVFCILLMAAGAAVLASPGLRSYLGGGTVYDDNAQTLNLSQTVNGWTLTLTDIVGDDQFLYVGVEMAAPEGVVPDPNLYPNLRLAEFSPQIKSGTAGSGRVLEDDDPTDNKLHFVFWQYTGEPSLGRNMTLSINRLCHWESLTEGEEQSLVTDMEGPWTFGPIRLNYTERSIELTPDVAVPLLGGETTVTDVKLTPLSIMVTLEGGNLADIHTTGPEKNGCWGLCAKETTLELYGKDGARWELPNPSRSGTWINTEGDRTGVCFSYDRLLNLDDLGYIEVCGVRIPVS